MKKLTLALIKCVFLVTASLFLGWFLFQLYSILPFGMPYPVEMFIRFYLSATGSRDVTSPDAIEVAASLLFSIVFTLLAGLILFLLTRWVTRYLIARKIGAPPPKLPIVIEFFLAGIVAMIVVDGAEYVSSLFIG
jgi:small-conductance mechanosensitive channel